MSAVPVAQALAAVIADLPGISKADKSPEGYAYRGVEAITKQLQPLLARHGVVIVPRSTVTQVVPSPAMKDGWQDVYAQVDWLIMGPDGSTIEARTNGIGRDRSDKGANKAQTQAYKYLLLHLLCIADSADDTDGQTYEHDRIAQHPLLHPDAVARFEEACKRDGVDVAAATRTATAGRTTDPSECFADETAAMRDALKALAAESVEGEGPVAPPVDRGTDGRGPAPLTASPSTGRTDEKVAS